jgi:hypothetical protein
MRQRHRAVVKMKEVMVYKKQMARAREQHEITRRTTLGAQPYAVL